MCNCNDSSEWINNAKNFIQSNNMDIMQKLIVQYLLNNNNCGVNNSTSINKLVHYLNRNGYSIDREQFQHQILIPLKKYKIIATLIYSGPNGGVFIPCDIEEIKMVYKQVLERVKSELQNISKSMHFQNNSNSIINIIDNELQNI